MTPHNQAILSFLNDYLTMDKPGYAVFLKGNWGCGKTYFIREWMKSLKEEKDEGGGHHRSEACLCVAIWVVLCQPDR